MLGGQNPCRASCFASVFFKQMVEFKHLFQKDQGKTTSVVRGTVEHNRLFQIDRGQTASAARILPPKHTRRPSSCLLYQSFFYGSTHIIQLSSTFPEQFKEIDRIVILFQFNKFGPAPRFLTFEQFFCCFSTTENSP